MGIFNELDEREIGKSCKSEYLKYEPSSGHLKTTQYSSQRQQFLDDIIKKKKEAKTTTTTTKMTTLSPFHKELLHHEHF